MPHPRLWNCELVLLAYFSSVMVDMAHVKRSKDRTSSEYSVWIRIIISAADVLFVVDCYV
jgi:hypothetical protein